MSFSCQMTGKELFQKKFKKKKVIFGVKSIKRERSILFLAYWMQMIGYLKA